MIRPIVSNVAHLSIHVHGTDVLRIANPGYRSTHAACDTHLSVHACTWPGRRVGELLRWHAASQLCDSWPDTILLS